MKILSFDVGIKNLAICILEYKENNIKIDLWEVINIIGDAEEEIHKCMYLDCDKKVKSYIDFDSKKYYLCTKHLNNKNELIFTNVCEKNWSEVKNSLCSKCSDNKIKKKIYKNINNEEMLCYKHYNCLMKNIEKSSNKVNNISSKKIKSVSTDFIKESLIKCLDLYLDKFMSVNMVYIENQPTLKNPTMKAISDTIYTWFLIRGIIDKNINNSLIDKIKFTSPSNKLKEFDKKSIEDADDNKKYKETKKLSICNTKIILDHYNLDIWNNIFTLHKKKDDLADCFLQGIYILNKDNDFIKNIIF